MSSSSPLYVSNSHGTRVIGMRASNNLRLWLIAGIIIAFGFYLLTKAIAKEKYFELVLLGIATVFIIFSFRKIRYQEAITKLITGMIIFMVVYQGYNLVLSYFVIPHWDYLCFYLFGKVGLVSTDFYNPEVFAQRFNELDLASRVSHDYILEIVNVGFWYPPSTMFVFLPLGMFGLETGHFIWQTMIIGFLLIDVYLLIKYYYPRPASAFSDQSKFPLFLLSLLLFPNLIATIGIGQTISILLFFLLVIIKDLNSYRAGICLALMIIFKPLAALLVFYFLFHKKWKTIISLTITGILIVGLTVLAFGYNSILNYFTSPPTSRIPDFVYYEYHSIYGTLLKIQRILPTLVSVPAIKLISYGMSAIMLGITIYASKKLAKRSEALAFLIFIPMALLVYPATLWFYSILLVPVVLYIFNQQGLKNTALNFIFLLILYGAGFLSVFFLNSLLWLMLVSWPLFLTYYNRAGALVSKKYSRQG